MALFRFSCVLGLLLFSFFNSSLKAQWSVTGGLYNIYEYSPEYSTGLSMIYIIYGDNNMSLGYTSAESGKEASRQSRVLYEREWVKDAFPKSHLQQVHGIQGI